MTKTNFDTNPVLLQTLLKYCEDGKLQLPDFQRSWVWEEERIMSLIASVSRGFPMGALMSLKSKIHEDLIFAKRQQRRSQFHHCFKEGNSRKMLSVY